jgi:peptidoglycan/LPS O-acetylase OafA/YrhL
MLKNKALRWLIALIYVVLFIWMWTHSKEPTLQDIPVIFGAGLILSLLSLVPFKNKNTNKALMILNIVLLIANIVMYFAAYRLVSGTFKN